MKARVQEVAGTLLLLGFIGVLVYVAYSRGWLPKSEYRNELLHILIEAIKHIHFPV